MNEQKAATEALSLTHAKYKRNREKAYENTIRRSRLGQYRMHLPQIDIETIQHDQGDRRK